MLKEIISNDLEMFLDVNEIAEDALIDGKSIRIIKDDDRLKERSKKEFDGITVGELLFFCKTSELPKVYGEGSVIRLNNTIHEVFSHRRENGMSEIILTKNRGV